MAKQLSKDRLGLIHSYMGESVRDEPADAERLVQRSVQGFRREGKSYATVAIGCTGGRHRSVAIAKELARRLGAGLAISVRHRDIAS